jgi:hypothetical protein
MKPVITTSILALCFLLGACSKSGDKDKAATKTESGHAPKDVVPGSHEDWCGEHEVPESQCTQCVQGDR